MGVGIPFPPLVLIAWSGHSVTVLVVPRLGRVTVGGALTLVISMFESGQVPL